MKYLFVFFLILFTIEGYAQEDLMVSTSDGISSYYLKGNIDTFISDGIKYAEFWVKVKPQNGKLREFRKSNIESRKSHRLPKMKAYNDYEYSMQLWNIDIKGRKVKIVESYAYSTSGTIIETYKDPNSEWITIVPDTIADAVWKYIVTILIAISIK